MSYRRSYLTILLLVGFSVVAGKISVNMVIMQQGSKSQTYSSRSGFFKLTSIKFITIALLHLVCGLKAK